MLTINDISCLSVLRFGDDCCNSKHVTLETGGTIPELKKPTISDHEINPTFRILLGLICIYLINVDYSFVFS